MLKPGYKQTDLGVLPEEWEVCSLSQLGELKNGINKSKEDFGHGFPFINLMDVFGISVINPSKKFGLINSSKGDRSAYSLLEGDVLFIRSSVKPEGVGLTALVAKDLSDTVFSGFLIRFRSNERLKSGYKTYCFADENFRKRVIESSTVSANTNINQDALRKLLIPVPPPAEQQAIAEALGAVDAILTSQQQLLAKKRALKLATQQALLSGERRLPGFAGESEFEMLGELILSKPAKAALEDKNELVSFIGMEDVSEYGQLLSSRQLSIQEVNKGLTYFERDDILVAKITPCFENGKGAHVDSLKTRKGFGSTEFHVLRANNNAIAKYIFYHTQSGDFRKKLEGEMIGTAGQKRVPIAAILNYSLPFGHSKAEQRAIAAILSDMDAEIEALAAQVAKTQALKQGMMQNLLTGNIRLRAGAAAPSSHPAL
ncbi:restriction endonuclease subunit S [Hymenobacter wooponensis]|uniref:Restriction endonuclease subunit S n=1 Tax=Hymenobacter wooponensis TaxID=1525360 RepID=A0A4Z0MNH5_9BACT|nr:restriction endonuclease subunit S [Hymenobacter wooponensis]TGD80807.1 restriction endonuclease subunit S [Hymenobacter wooponensis]